MAQSDGNFAELLKQSETRAVKALIPGEKISAVVASIDRDTIFLDVGAKSEGIVDAFEFVDETGTLTIAPGDSVEVFFLKVSSGQLLFTKRIGTGSDSAHFEEAWRGAVPVVGTVKGEIKGGFEIALAGGVRGFCPYSQMGLRRVENPVEEYVGAQMNFLITRYEPPGRNIVLSARALMEQEREEKRRELRDRLEIDQVVEGTVSSIQPFGVFVDLGGIDGLVPGAEVGWSRVDNLAEHFQVGQPVKVLIKSLDWDKERIGLSIKDTLEDPWQKVEEQFASGTSHIGAIARLAPFGVFVTLAPGIDGLVHISKLGSGRRISHPREVVEAGQNMEVVVESIDLENRKISLAPADYTNPEEESHSQEREFKEYRQKQKKQSDNQPEEGSFGALLRAKLAQKKR
ncbi:MAG: 30S ribosomal protein S1 [Desulfofustis sp. PB-SRB1]|jgi:small subunit ribosomal protein S1|nr:30S ribosomal protein S1 [Desulfofustis sp. PB-SRB1]MBM1001390.1 30S ribosomal protein S1 [Desulfofustis sp. PB-SRB1]HBH28074.1 30S ribosomal protein S1 [Desulfofustis sp.]